MTYEYKCKECGNVLLSQTHGLESLISCGVCDGPIRRVYSISVKRDIPEHFNPQTGGVVRGMQQLKRDLRDAGDKQWERTGIPHRYIPMDLRELPQPAEAREESDRRQVEDHWRDPKFIAPVTQ